MAFDVEIDEHDMLEVDMIREGMNDFQGEDCTLYNLETFKLSRRNGRKPQNRGPLDAPSGEETTRTSPTSPSLFIQTSPRRSTHESKTKKFLQQ